MCWIRSVTLFVEISLTLGTLPGSAASPEPTAAAVIRRVAWFAEAGFPPPPAAPLAAEDGVAIRAAFAGAGWEVEELDAAALARPDRLTCDRFDLLFLPYGACFPEEAHENVVRFHQAGGHLFWFGAAAGRPVRWEDGLWRHWPLGQHYNLGGPYQADFGLSWSRWGNDHQPVTLTARAREAFPAVPLPESLGRIGYCHLLSGDDFRWTSAYRDTVVLPLWESRPGDHVTGHGAVLIRHHDPDFPDGTTLIAFGTPDPPKLQGNLTADVIVQLARLCVTPLEGDPGSTLHAARIRVLDRAEQLAEVWSQATWARQDARAMAPSGLTRQAAGHRPDWESLSSECLDAMDLARELDYGDGKRLKPERLAPRLRSVFDLPPQSLEQYQALARELERLRAQCEPFTIPARSEEPAAGPEADEPVRVGTCAPEVGFNGPVRFLRTAAKARRFGLDHFLGFALWWAPDLELSDDPPSSPPAPPLAGGSQGGQGGWEQRTASLRFQSQLARKAGVRLILMFAQPNLILDGRADSVLRQYQPRPAEVDMATGELQELPAEPGASPYPWWDWDWGPWMEDEFPRWVEALITLRLRDDPRVFGYNQVNEWSLTRWWQHGRWLTDFREFLRQHYGSVDRLNEAWDTAFADWAEVQPPRRFPRDWATLEALPAELLDHAAWYDWALFRVEILTRCHRLLYEAVKRADPQRPLISRDSFGDLVRGIDLSRLARLCDYFGVHYAPYPGHLAYAQSMARNRPLLLSEYYWDGFTFQPPDRYSAARLREGMWTAMAHGAVGFQFFNWFINRGAWTSGDGVFSILADASDHVGAPAFELARMKEQSARFLRVVREGHPARRQVAILQPLSSHLNRTGADIPGMPPWITPTGTYFWTLYGTWEMGELAGHQSDFLTEEQITPETLSSGAGSTSDTSAIAGRRRASCTRITRNTRCAVQRTTTTWQPCGRNWAWRWRNPSSATSRRSNSSPGSGRETPTFSRSTTVGSDRRPSASASAALTGPRPTCSSRPGFHCGRAVSPPGWTPDRGGCFGWSRETQKKGVVCHENDFLQNVRQPEGTGPFGPQSGCGLVPRGGDPPARGEASEPLPPARLTVRANEPIRTVPREIFGVNLEWFLDGSGLWNKDAGTYFPDRLKQVAAIGFGSFRYPGGTLSDYFHWKETIGDDRKKQYNPFYDQQNPQNKHLFPAFGAAEFLQTCRELKALPWLTCNVGTGTAEEAAAWARWCREQGLEVTHWEVGNEMYLKPDRPENVSMTPQEYVRAFNEFARALKEVNPQNQVCAIGQPQPEEKFKEFVPCPDWNDVLLENCADQMDCLALHNAYATALTLGPDGQECSDEAIYRSLLGAAVFVRHSTADILALLRTQAPQRADQISLAITEHEGLFFPLPGQDAIQVVKRCRTLASAVYLATLYNFFMSEPKIRFAHKMTLITPIFGGVLNTTFEPQGEVWPNPQYFVCQEYARCAGETAVRCEVQSEAYAAPAVGFIPPLPAVPYLDAAATRSESGVLSVFLVNRSLTSPLPVQVEWVGYQATSARATTLTGPRYDSTNDDPARTTVKPEERDVPGASPLTVELPPCSLTVLRLADARQGSRE